MKKNEILKSILEEKIDNFKATSKTLKKNNFNEQSSFYLEKARLLEICLEEYEEEMKDRCENCGVLQE
jgi:hypothetical protein